ncbi:MAG: apolipoprotein N-acyltransferase [Actinobacteria bacterium]|nr:apolipoprotein N-acyltransferase [Actinomycetota bacterium]
MVMTLIAAFLASASFEPIGIWFLALFGFALFFRKIQRSNRPIWHSFLFGFTLNAIVLHWSGKYVGALPWLLLSFLQALFYLPIGFIYKKTNSLWYAALGLIVFEEIRSRFPFGGFGWTRIAFSQVESPALPIVAIGGAISLSIFTIFGSLLLTRITLKNVSLLVTLFILTIFLPLNPQGSGSLNLLAIQGNTPEVGLEFNSRAKAVFNLHRDATIEFANGNFDAIVWPENAIDIDPRMNVDVATDIKNLTKELDVPLIAGVVQQENGQPENASILYEKDGGRTSVYVKRGLTPFGEYMPLRTLAEFVSPMAKTVTDFVPGKNRVVHKVSGFSLGPIICYEIIKDDLVRDMAINSQALIVQTNSATFANTAESAQQLAITRIRAVEHSRAILSVSTIGISAFIDANGRVISQTPENKRAYLLGQLGMSQHKTLADKLHYVK